MKPCDTRAYLRHVGYGDVPRLSYNLYGEVGFKSGFVKTGEGSSSKGRFKLCGRQDPDIVKKREATEVRLQDSACPLTAVHSSDDDE